MCLLFSIFFDRTTSRIVALGPFSIDIHPSLPSHLAGGRYLRSSSMEMQGYYGSSDGGWSYHPLASFPPLCSSSPSPLLMSEHDYLPIVTAPADDHGALGDCSVALVLREEEATGYMPVIPSPATTDDLYSYPLNVLPPLPPDGATAGLDDALLLLPFSDIDLEAFGDVVDERESGPPDTAIVPADHHFVVGEQYTRPMEISNQQQQNAARGVLVHDHNDDSMSMIGVTGYETGVGYKNEQQQARPPAVPARRVRSSSNGSAAPARRTRLDHIGFDELRKYFYMPITKAARMMNVGLTVLKKRCRELGVARWPHRKMKSLKSLLLNVQEMGKGMSPAAVQRELAALETYCALMEENPAIELTERTKKLRQACFKENYKRRRAAAVNMLDRCYNFGHQQLPPPPTISRNSQSGSFFGF